MPQAWQLPVLLLGLQAAAPPQELYVTSVREAIRLGGCSASRAALVGACAAAIAGSVDSVPMEWQSQLPHIAEVHALALKVQMSASM